MEYLYGILRRYAEEKQLANLQKALPLIREKMENAQNHPDSMFRDAVMHRAYFRHCLSVCHILVELQPELSGREEDILLSAAVCHVLPENIRFLDLDEALAALDPQVRDTVRLIYREGDGIEAQDSVFYESIRQDKLALLIKLADRGNLVEQLHSIAGSRSRRYMYETRTYFLPLCLYAKEHYPELIPPVSILMEKMRCLLEVSEILLGRYEALEAELTGEILALQEDNSALRRAIRTLLHNNP